MEDQTRASLFSGTGYKRHSGGANSKVLMIHLNDVEDLVSCPKPEWGVTVINEVMATPGDHKNIK